MATNGNIITKQAISVTRIGGDKKKMMMHKLLAATLTTKRMQWYCQMVNESDWAILARTRVVSQSRMVITNNCYRYVYVRGEEVSIDWRREDDLFRLFKMFV